jgi:hypothetical protein
MLRRVLILWDFLSAAPPGYSSPNRLVIFINVAGSPDFAWRGI